MDENNQRLIERLQAALELLAQVRAANQSFRKSLRDAKPRTRQGLEAGLGFAREAEDFWGGLTATLNEAVADAEQLHAKQVAAAANTIKTSELVNNFRKVIDNIQREARAPQTGDVGVTLQNLDVEVKGFLALEQNEARLISPTLNRTAEAGQLSTLRLAFGTVPVVQPAEEITPRRD